MKQLRIPLSVLVVFLILQFGSAQTRPAKPSVRRSGYSPVPEMGLALRDGWSLQASGKVEKPGEIISTQKFAPTGWYTVSVPTTVVGTLTVYHPVCENFGVEMTSPGFSTLHEGCSDQPSRSASPISGTGEEAAGFRVGLGGCICAKPICEIRNKARTENGIRSCFIRPLL